MSRTDQEFKAEVLRRSEAYRRHRRERRKKLMNTALCVVLVVGGMYLVSPFLASGGSSEPAANDAMEAPMAIEEGAYENTGAPGTFAAQSVTGDSKTAAEPWDLIPMVMVNGVIYMDTGYCNEDVRKCGTFDGEITSQVAGSEIPSEDDQSNFGVGYGYQYGEQEGTVEINMNGKWWIFATEDVREDIQFPD